MVFSSNVRQNTVLDCSTPTFAIRISGLPPRRLIIASPRVFNLRSLSIHTRFQAFDLVGRVGLEPTVFLVCRIYSAVPSPLGYLPILVGTLALESRSGDFQSPTLPFKLSSHIKSCRVLCHQARSGVEPPAEVGIEPAPRSTSAPRTCPCRTN